MNVMQGTPYAGNPHVTPAQCYGGISRFDKGGIASATPRRGPVLYSMDMDVKRKPKKTGLVAFLMGVLTCVPLVAAEKVSAGFTLCTGISHEVGVAETFLSRYWNSKDSNVLQKFSSEKPSFFVIKIY